MTPNERQKLNRSKGLCPCGKPRDFLSAQCKNCNEIRAKSRGIRRAKQLKQISEKLKHDHKFKSHGPLPPTRIFHKTRNPNLNSV